MKVAVVYNEKGSRVINVFGRQNQEWYPPETLALASRALRNAGHTVEPVVADQGLLARLDAWLPRQTGGQITGIVFNLALGLQGECRYTHVPAILESAGIPYTGSSPIGHALALNKVVAKRILLAAGVPTPRFAVFESTRALAHELNYPLVVKPESEAASFGLSVVEDEKALRRAVALVLEAFRQPALVEEFIAGREVNISLYGNHPPVVLPILELEVRGERRNVFSHDLKFDHSGTRVKKVCPANLGAGLQASLEALAVRTFELLHIQDYARVDFRLDENSRPWVLELNSMASINPASSFVHAARVAGMDYDALINTILETACLRYSREKPGRERAPDDLACVADAT